MHLHRNKSPDVTKNTIFHQLASHLGSIYLVGTIEKEMLIIISINFKFCVHTTAKIKFIHSIFRRAFDFFHFVGEVGDDIQENIIIEDGRHPALCSALHGYLCIVEFIFNWLKTRFFPKSEDRNIHQTHIVNGFSLCPSSVCLSVST